jgi:hypothetical protein
MASVKETNQIGGMDEGAISKWKKQHGELTLVTVEVDEGELFFWFRKPDMKTISAVTKVAQTDPVASTQALFRNCLLNQNNIHYADDPEVFLAVGPHLEELVKKRKASSQRF